MGTSKTSPAWCRAAAVAVLHDDDEFDVPRDQVADDLEGEPFDLFLIPRAVGEVQQIAEIDRRLAAEPLLDRVRR